MCVAGCGPATTTTTTTTAGCCLDAGDVYDGEATHDRRCVRVVRRRLRLRAPAALWRGIILDDVDGFDGKVEDAVGGRAAAPTFPRNAEKEFPYL